MVIRKYELMFIVNPELSEEELESLLERIKGYLTDAKADILSFRLWGFRRLAYSIRGHKEGRYYLAQFAMDTQKLAPFEHSLQLLSEGVLRELVTCLPDDFVPEVVEEPQKEPTPVEAPSKPTKEEAPADVAGEEEATAEGAEEKATTVEVEAEEEAAGTEESVNVEESTNAEEATEETAEEADSTDA